MASTSTVYHTMKKKKLGGDSYTEHQKKVDKNKAVPGKGLNSEYLSGISREKILEATRELLEELRLLDEVDRRDYLLILAAGPTWVTVRELLAEVKILVRKKKEDQKLYLRHLEI